MVQRMDACQRKKIIIIKKYKIMIIIPNVVVMFSAPL